MPGGALRIGTFRGIEVRLHVSWLLAVVFLTWSLASGWFPEIYPGWPEPTYYLVAGIAATLLFASVLLHEFGHALTAIRLGIPVQSITLFVFGGVAELKRESDRPGAEFWIAIMGPVVSAALALGFFLLRLVVAPISEQVLAIVSYLALLNGLLLVFNLVPGFPLDGGRILRAILWGAMKDYQRATAIAVRIGQGVAFFMIAWGFFQVLGGDLLGGAWTAMIGWFLSNAASATGQQATLQQELAGVRVADVMEPLPPLISPTLTLGRLINDYMLPHAQRAYLIAEEGQVLGLLTLSDLLRREHSGWDEATVAEVMTPATQLVTTTPETPLTAALQQLAEGNIHQLPVIDGDRPVGFISRAGLVQYLQLRGQLEAVGAVAPQRAGNHPIATPGQA